MNQPWNYMYSPSRSPLPPPSLPDSSGSSQCISPEHLSHASNLGWWSVSPLIIYMFRHCSLETSHPPLLPQSPKVCSVHLCLFFNTEQLLREVRYRDSRLILRLPEDADTFSGFKAWCKYTLLIPSFAYLTTFLSKLTDAVCPLTVIFPKCRFSPLNCKHCF